MSTGGAVVGGEASANSNPAAITTTTTNSNPTTTTTTTNQPNRNINQHTNNINININTNTNNSNTFEVENQFILRMPVIKLENGMVKPHPATQALREALADQAKRIVEDAETGNVSDDPLRSRLFIDINPETRKGRVKFDDDVFEARLVDLPCIIESLKTIDKKMFYKTTDICQMLVCRTRDEPAWSDDENEEEKAKKAAATKKPGGLSSQAESFLRKYQWPHGITPPLKNVRRKRFRKLAKKKIIDYAEIEREVK